MSLQSSVDFHLEKPLGKNSKEKILEEKYWGEFALWDVKMYTKAAIIKAL